MSASGKPTASRRAAIVGGLAAVGVGAIALAVIDGPRLFASRYKPSPYDDLLAQLPDRDNATVVGKAVLAKDTSFNAPAAAAELRTTLKDASLAVAMKADMAQDRVAEIHGWILPMSFVLVSALAAKAM